MSRDVQWLASRTLQRTLAGITTRACHRITSLHRSCTHGAFDCERGGIGAAGVHSRKVQHLARRRRLPLHIQETGVPDRIGNIIKATRVVWGDAVEGNARSILLVIEGEFIKAVRESQFLFASDPSILKLLDEMNTNAFCRKGILEESLHT